MLSLIPEAAIFYACTLCLASPGFYMCINHTLIFCLMNCFVLVPSYLYERFIVFVAII